MYSEYFGLSEPPFSIAPDPRYLFPSAQHVEALAHLAYGATEGDGFIQLTGEIGTGKTTLIRRLLTDMPEGVDIAFLFNPEVSRRGLLINILAELGLPRPPSDCEHSELLSRLYRHLLAARTRGHRVVLVIDEAQRLGPEVLEEVRLLTNFETDRRKLLNVILVGQPELKDTLARPDLRQLAQRITARYHLGPISLQETDAYIHHRLKRAGAPGRIFRPRAVRAVQRHSQGIPRLINLICDRALMAACTRGLREVGPGVVDDAARELAGAAPKGGGLRPLWLGCGIALAALLGAGVAWWVVNWQTRTPHAVGKASIVASPMLAAGPDLPVRSRTVPAAPEKPATVPRGQPLRDWLKSLPAAPGKKDAGGMLLALWHVAPLDADSAIADPCSVAARSGLGCLHVQGNVNLLRSFNRPAAVALNVAGERHEVVVTALDDGRITLAAATGEQRSFPLAGFESLWYGRMWLLWRPPRGVRLIRRGMSGPAVVWLKRALGLPAPAQGRAVYDGALEQAVRAFQRRHALVPDGIAGPETLIVLRRWQGMGSGPRLIRERGMQT
ncbi:MAG: AAA family ATPase [Gammaproteobacteria bacterium]|nr:AAA family ATPase [Gammaproteobacteria bacterium]